MFWCISLILRRVRREPTSGSHRDRDRFRQTRSFHFLSPSLELEWTCRGTTAASLTGYTGSLFISPSSANDDAIYALWQLLLPQVPSETTPRLQSFVGAVMPVVEIEREKYISPTSTEDEAIYALFRLSPSSIILKFHPKVPQVQSLMGRVWALQHLRITAKEETKLYLWGYERTYIYALCRLSVSFKFHPRLLQGLKALLGPSRVVECLPTTEGEGINFFFHGWKPRLGPLPSLVKKRGRRAR